MGARALALAATFALFAMPSPPLLAQSGGEAATASEPSAAPVRSPILIVDSERLFKESAFGRRVAEEFGSAFDALAAENRGIEAELTEEVEALTEARPDMEVGAFREAAAAFDEKVQAIRQEQDTKESTLQETLDKEREAFLAAATPVLGKLMTEAGAAVIFDRRSVFLATGLVDVTDQAIAAIDAEIGAGEGAAISPPEFSAEEEQPEGDLVIDLPEEQADSPEETELPVLDPAGSDVEDD